MKKARIAVMLSVILSSLLLLSHARVPPTLDESNAVAVRDQQPDPNTAADSDTKTLTLETSALPVPAERDPQPDPNTAGDDGTKTLTLDTSALPAATGDGDDAFRYVDFSLRQPFRRHRFIRRPTDRHLFGIRHRFGFRHHRHHHHHHHRHHAGEGMGIRGAGIAGQEIGLPWTSAEWIAGREIGLPVRSAEWVAAVERKEEEKKGKKKVHKKKKYDSDSDSDSDSELDDLEEKEWKKAKKEHKKMRKRGRAERAKSGFFGWFWAMVNRLGD